MVWQFVLIWKQWHQQRRAIDFVGVSGESQDRDSNSTRFWRKQLELEIGSVISMLDE